MRAKDGRSEVENYLRERAAPGGRAVAWGSVLVHWVAGTRLLRQCWGSGAALAGLGSGSCTACAPLPGLEAEGAMTGKRARGGCGECQLDGERPNFVGISQIYINHFPENYSTYRISEEHVWIF